MEKPIINLQTFHYKTPYFYVKENATCNISIWKAVTYHFIFTHAHALNFLFHINWYMSFQWPPAVTNSLYYLISSEQISCVALESKNMYI